MKEILTHKKEIEASLGEDFLKLWADGDMWLVFVLIEEDEETIRLIKTSDGVINFFDNCVEYSSAMGEMLQLLYAEVRYLRDNAKQIEEQGFLNTEHCAAIKISTLNFLANHEYKKGRAKTK